MSKTINLTSCLRKVHENSFWKSWYRYVLYIFNKSRRKLLSCVKQTKWLRCTEELNAILKLGISITKNINNHKFYRKGNCRGIIFRDGFKIKTTFGFWLQKQSKRGSSKISWHKIEEITWTGKRVEAWRKSVFCPGVWSKSMDLLWRKPKLPVNVSSAIFSPILLFIITSRTEIRLMTYGD